MKSRKPGLILILLAFAALALWAQTSSPPGVVPAGNSPSAAAPVNPASQSSWLRILTPVVNQKLSSNFADVRYQLTTPAASAGTPNFLVQLDGDDPIHTTSTEYNFTGLTPGTHTVTVTVIDANQTPINGGSAQVQFMVAQPPQQPATKTPQQGSPNPTRLQQQNAKPAGVSVASVQPQVREASFFGPPPQLSDDDDSKLPSASSALPLLSVIGFGVLLGGIASAMKTR